MLANAVTERIIDVPLDVAFQHFIDFSRWDQWMPADFRPISGPARALRSGDAFKVGIGRSFMTLKLEVLRVRANKEVCWSGGFPVLRGEHSFFFSGALGKTLVRSEEALSGWGVRKAFVHRLETACVQSAEELLARFSDYVLELDHTADNHAG